MTKLDRLIAKLCPDGVEYVTIESVCTKVSSGGTPNTSRRNFYGGDIPWLRTQEIDWVNITDTGVKITQEGLNNSSAKWIPKNCVIIAMYGATAAKVAINKIPLTTNQACCNLHVDENIALYRYVYFWLSNNYEELKAMGQGSQSNINAKILRDYLIPVPPLPIQHEIVRILDNFTDLTAELTTELTTELTARKKQYEFYRDELLSFKDDIPIMKLEEISQSISTGVTPLASNPDYYDGNIPWLRTQELHYVDIWDTEMRVTEKALNETSLKWIPVNCVIVAISGATAGRIGINKIPLTTNQHCCCFEINNDKALYKYVFYCLSKANKDLLQLKQGARGDLNAGIIKRFSIPLPSITEQERIVAILDRFDALTTDISNGLPAEIAARQKQYEYYRDKLLSFPTKKTATSP